MLMIEIKKQISQLKQNYNLNRSDEKNSKNKK